MAEQVENIKWVPNTRFLVDGFRFQSPRCSSYFLTHMHGDHYTGETCSWASSARNRLCSALFTAYGCSGLSKSFGVGQLEAVHIFCSKITAELLVHDFGIPAHRVCALPLDQPVTVDGVLVTLVDANHVSPWSSSSMLVCVCSCAELRQGLTHLPLRTAVSWGGDVSV